jgi:hypothetical protein
MARTLTGLTIALAMLCSNSASGQLAATISLETTDEPDGRIRYEYLVENLPESTSLIDVLLLDVAEGSDPELITQPEGWLSDYAPSEPNLRLGWISGPGSEIPIGGSGMFGFTSAFTPGDFEIEVVIGDFLPDLTGFADALFGSVAGPLVAPPTGIPGDYNGNGQVEQADLDLVLLNWGADGAVPPDDWINDLPVDTIDQAELDGVLLNWGNMAALGSSAGVPEPSGMWLTFLCIAALTAHCRLGILSRKCT